MSVFICWSGERSHRLADAVKTLIVGSIESLRKDDVFISDNIDKGAAWRTSIDEQLEKAKAGIICLTAENLQSPWLHFEAGALTRRLNALPKPVVHSTSGQKKTSKSEAEPRRLFTILHGVSGAALVEPLSAYQSTVTTETDMGAMVLALARVLEIPDMDEIEKRSSIISRKRWNAFEKTLDSLTVPARDIVRELDRLFQRKTFNEPIYRCTDQAWVRRYDGARDTHEQLEVHLDRVRAACSAHEHAVFGMLLTELDGYEMAMQSLLLRPRKFELVDDGQLDMDPAVRTCCEDRRLAIRSLATRLVHPLDQPLREEAVRFMGAETDEERKMIVHRLEGAIRRQREVVYALADRGVTEPAASREALETLTGGRRPIEYRASSWDLDRIYYYLLLEYFTKGTLWSSRSENRPARRAGGRHASRQPDVRGHDWLCAARDIQMEVERYRAKSKGGSLMPLIYALSALQELHVENCTDDEVRLTVQGALDLVDQDLGSALDSEPGPTIRRLVAKIRKAGNLPSPSRAVAANAVTAARAAGTASASARPRRAGPQPPSPRIRRTNTPARSQRP